MIRIDGPEHSIVRLIGAPRGYVGHDSGGQLTEYVRPKPYSIVLIDEIEKASREFVPLLLQILDDGRLTDCQGRVVDFRNTVIMMTSNLGAAYLNDMSEGPVRPHTRQLVMGAIQGHFLPKVIIFVRDSDIFYYRRFEMLMLIALSSAHFLRRTSCVSSICALKKWKMTLQIDGEAKDYLAACDYSPVYGARPLNRAIQTELPNSLSVMLLSERVRDGEVVRVGFDGPRNRLHISANHEGSQVEGIDGMDVDYDDEDDLQMD